MYNLGDDKELDRLSREAAGRYAPPGKANWQALSEELDRVMPVTEEKKRRFLFWWLFPLLVAGGAAVHWMSNRQEAPQPVENTVALTQLPAITGTDHPVKVADTKEAVTANENLAQKNASTISVTKQVSSSPILSGTKKEQNDHPFNEKSLRNSNSRNNNQQSNGQIDPLTRVQPAGNQESPVRSLKATQETTTDPLILAQKTEQGSPVTPTSETDSSAAVTNPNSNPATETNAPVVTVKRPSGKGFSYALVLGVDKSTVKFRYGNSPGINIGILAGYHISNRWSVHTGAIYTQKNYKVAGADFTAPKGTWISYYKLEDVTGYCRMWEVPLLARYTMGHTANKSSFLSAGLSSYFMTSENYDYFYYYNGQPVTRNSSLNSSDKHVLSIVHLSAGFEKPLSKKWSIQVEPYAKLPLGGVGFGSIRLSSFGLNLLLQHRQPAKK